MLCLGSVDPLPLLARRHYANGWERPRLRGVLHGVIAVMLAPLLVACCLALLVRALPWRWWRFAMLLFAKLVSHFASSMLHLYPHRSVSELIVWMRLDMVAICFAVWAPTSAFSNDVQEWLVLLCVACMVAVATYKLSASACVASVSVSRVVEEVPPLAGQRLLRLALNMGFFVWSCSFVGWHYGFRGHWAIGTVFYVAGTLTSPAFYRLYPPAPWHNTKWNGWHEDFHVFVALADVTFASMACEFLSDPSVDHRPGAFWTYGSPS